MTFYGKSSSVRRFQCFSEAQKPQVAPKLSSDKKNSLEGFKQFFAQKYQNVTSAAKCLLSFELQEVLKR